ncbi:MAG: DUF6159 family protein [Candidatus Woesearchaeota archaeon]
MGVFARSWEITKLCLNVIKADKEMMLFPLLGGLFSLIFLIAMVFPTIIVNIINNSGMSEISQGLVYIIVFLTYLGLAFIATFFNVCVVYTAKTRFEGGNATFKDSISFALSRIHLIFVWSLVSATVGLLLHILDRIAEKLGQGGKIILLIVRSILGMVWSIITIFVVPVMVYENIGPIQAIKRSVETLKKTWGESLVRAFGLGLVQMLFFILGIVIGIIIIILSVMTGSLFAIIIGISIVVIYFVLMILFFSVLNTIFNTALYVYASKGKIPDGFSKEILQNAFRSGKKNVNLK